LAIFDASEVEVPETALLRRDEHTGDLWSFERSADGIGVRRPHDDGGPAVVRLLQPGRVGDAVEHERLVERKLVLPLDHDLRHAAPGGAEPALPHKSTDSPGSGVRISTSLGTRRFNSSGRPTSTGK